MAPPDIIQCDDPILRRHAAAVPAVDITTPEIQTIIADMHAALRTHDDGVALAAPQIGIAKRIFIVSQKAFRTHPDEPVNEATPGLVCINPEIIRRSRANELLHDGCLSVQGYYGQVERAHKVTVRAHDAAGHVFTRGASGLLAQIFQHEIDHLDGILFTDKAQSVWPHEHADGA